MDEFREIPGESVQRVSNDHLGKRGERIFEVLILAPCGRPEPFFDPVFLGERFPTLDYYVELVGATARYFFFVQVKSTRAGCHAIRGQRRLPVNVSQQDVNRLVAFPAPTYVVGIDEVARRGYILSVNEPRGPIASLPTKFPLTCANLRRLWEEVQRFWSSRNMVLQDSFFVE